MATVRRIGLKEIQQLQPNSIIWDELLAGFGARRQRSAAIAYVLYYRTQEGTQRWHTIGRHGAPWTPDTARAEAKRLLGGVAGGADPSADKQTKRKAATVAELCDLYFADAKAGRVFSRRTGVAKKSSTLLTDHGRIERHIKPLLGSKKVASVTLNDVEAFMHAVAEGKTAVRIKSPKSRGITNVRGGMGAASRTVGLLGAIFTYAIRHRMRTDNPVRGVIRPADGRRTRRLSDEEYMALGDVLRSPGNVWPAAVSATQFLAFTGWRSGEVLGLRWKDIDLARRTATLPDTKTGSSIRPLANVACDVLRKLTRGDGPVFEATRGDGSLVGYSKMWAKIARRAKLPKDVTPHTMRHSFSSIAGDLGFSEPTIAALVGHKGQSITSRYIHSADAVLLAAVDAVADETSRRMGYFAPAADVVDLQSRRR